MGRFSRQAKGRVGVRERTNIKGAAGHNHTDMLKHEMMKRQSELKSEFKKHVESGKEVFHEFNLNIIVKNLEWKKNF